METGEVAPMDRPIPADLDLPQDVDTSQGRDEPLNCGCLSIGFSTFVNGIMVENTARMLDRIVSLECLLVQSLPTALREPLIRLLSLKSLKIVTIYYDDAPFRNMLDAFTNAMNRNPSIKSFGFQHCHGLELEPYVDFLEANSHLTGFEYHDCALNDEDNDVTMEELGTLLRHHKSIRKVNMDDPDLMKHLAPSDTLEEIQILGSSIGMIAALITSVPKLTNLRKLTFGGHRDLHLKPTLMASMASCPRLETVACSRQSRTNPFLNDQDRRKLQTWAQRNRQLASWLHVGKTDASLLPKSLWSKFLEMTNVLSNQNEIIFSLLSKHCPLFEHVIQREYQSDNFESKPDSKRPRI